MKILICDDDLLFLKKMDSMIRNYCKEAGLQVSVFAVNQKEELTHLECAQLDIVFLDIDMGDINGLDVAKKIRAYNHDTIIIFVTNYLEYAPESFEVDAFRYLLKQKLDEKLKLYLQEAIDLHKQKHKVVTFQISGEVIDIPTEDILYAESDKRVIMLYRLTNLRDPYRFYSTMEAMEQKLEPLGFLRVQKSYLVNMAHIKNLQCGQVELSNLVTLSVSKKNYSEIKKKYLLWSGKNKWII